jgi:uncharacterized membrane protein YfcA
MPELTSWQWLLGGLCAAMIGVAKTGVPGVGILAVPLMVLTVGEARASAGWLLPVLVTADVMAVIIYRRHAEARTLFSLMPWILVGMLFGTLALGLEESVLRHLVGAIVLVMIALHMARKWQIGPFADADHTRWHHAGRFGVAAGFATTVANAAGPVMNLYLLSKQLPKEEFVAAGAWFFLIVNLMKVPLYAWRGMITGTSLVFDLLVVPAAVLGALGGRAIMRRLPQSHFEHIVLGFTTLAALLLFLPGFRR